MRKAASGAEDNSSVSDVIFNAMGQTGLEIRAWS